MEDETYLKGVSLQSRHGVDESLRADVASLVALFVRIKSPVRRQRIIDTFKQVVTLDMKEHSQDAATKKSVSSRTDADAILTEIQTRINDNQERTKATQKDRVA